jgi:phosphate transport system substrate-binding protein
MSKFLKTVVGFGLLILLFVFSCQKKDENNQETILKGKATLYVDESLLPIIEDQEAVFENQYDAKLHLVAKSENEVLNALLNDTAKIAILARTLSDKEIKVFQSKKINPKITPFASDAIAFIKNKKANDTLIALQDIIDFMQGKEVKTIKGLVFDNPNSSTFRHIMTLSNIKVPPQKNIFSFKTNNDVIKYVSENDGMIGVVGINWLFQPSLEMQQTVDNINLLSVKDTKTDEFVFPSQDNIASRKYPLARDLFIVNCQGYSGLGMGFGSFITGERGQRIVLKSGLVPVRFPSRKIITRNQITNEIK